MGSLSLLLFNMTQLRTSMTFEKKYLHKKFMQILMPMHTITNKLK